MAQAATASTSAATPTTADKEYAGVRISLENCLFPPESIEEPPSLKDGLDISTENDLRRIGCEFIQIAGILLKVPQVAMATAQVLFQRFFFAKSFVKHKMEEIAMACIWLATKVEECPRRVRDVINVFHYLRLTRNKLPVVPMVLDQNYVNLKNNVIKAERRVLKELGFCVHVKHPHKIIVVYLQVLEMEKNRELVQTAWNYMNDSLQTTVFVKYPPETIACACIYLAARVLQIPLPNRTHWFYLFNATEEDIQNICITLLCVYQTLKTPYEVLEKKVEACRNVIQQEKLKAKGALASVGASNAPLDNSPASRHTSPFNNSPAEGKDGKGHRSSTVPTGREDGTASVGDDGKSKQEDSRKSHNGVKRSRTRSTSNNRSSKYRKSRQSSGSSSSDASSSERPSNDADRQRRGRSSEALPKSYSHHNSNRSSAEKHRHRRHKPSGKTRHSKSHRRDDRERRRSRDLSRSGRHDSSGKKHKRKLSASESSPPTIPLSHLNGEKMSSTSPTTKKHRRHRTQREPEKKKKLRRSLSPSRMRLKR